MGLRRRLGNRTFWSGAAVGVGLVFLVRLAINESTFPDRLIESLLVVDSLASADAIVVLGAGTTGNCVPNANGLRRAMLGAKLFREGRAPLLAITGGSPDGHCPVADAMAQVVRDVGVPTDRILVERDSLNTHENGERTAPLLRKRGVTRILLVSDRLHMRRASGVFRQLGFTVEPAGVPIFEGHADNVSMLTTGIREYVALAYYTVRGWSGQPAAAADQGRGRGVAERADAAGSSDGGALVVLGASYAAGWKLTDVDGVRLINAGVAGQQSFELLARFDRDVVAKRPRAVVIWGFINDIYRTADPMQARARVLESYAAMVARARAHQIEPILATEVTIRPPKGLVETAASVVGSILGKQAYQDRINAHVFETNQALSELARREHVLLLDFQATLAGGDGRRRRRFAVDDGSHISPAGYDALTEYARPILSSHLRSSARANAEP